MRGEKRGKKKGTGSVGNTPAKKSAEPDPRG